jgi:hypothetical protein
LSFTSFIKKQANLDSPVGDFARDFVYILDNYPLYPECRGTDVITSETLYGHYMFLSSGAKNREWLVKTLSDTWREWLEYKHIGLKYGVPKRGYVYFFKLENEENIFKIGRTSTSPEERMLSVSIKERAKIVMFDIPSSIRFSAFLPILWTVSQVGSQDDQ